jgi:hypothetical protein
MDEILNLSALELLVRTSRGRGFHVGEEASILNVCKTGNPDMGMAHEHGILKAYKLGCEKKEAKKKALKLYWCLIGTTIS